MLPQFCSLSSSLQFLALSFERHCGLLIKAGYLLNLAKRHSGKSYRRATDAQRKHVMCCHRLRALMFALNMIEQTHPGNGRKGTSWFDRATVGNTCQYADFFHDCTRLGPASAWYTAVKLKCPVSTARPCCAPNGCLLRGKRYTTAEPDRGKEARS